MCNDMSENCYYAAYLDFISEHPELADDPNIEMFEEIANENYFQHLSKQEQDYQIGYPNTKFVYNLRANSYPTKSWEDIKKDVANSNMDEGTKEDLRLLFEYLDEKLDD